MNMPERKRILYAVLALIVFVLLYITSQYVMHEPEEGRVVGRITYGPAYPGPCREGADCADKAYTGIVYVNNKDSGKEVGEFRTDDNGVFDIKLKPGRYYLEVSRRFVSICGRDIEVEASKVANATFSCDTGIR